VADLIRNAGSIAAAVTALLALTVLVAKLPPTRWLFRHLVADPVTQAFRREVGEVVDERLEPVLHELEFNHGTSLKDAVWSIAEHTGAAVPPRTKKEICR
jgi:hypothetical protein